MFWGAFGRFRDNTVAKRRHPGPVLGVLALAALAGCAGVGGLSADSPPDVKRDAVAARARARWDRLINRDVAGAYEFLSPASRATMPLDLYKAKHKVGLYKAVKVNDVKCEADTCTVDLSLTYDYKRVKGVATPVREKWIITQGQAWLVERG